MHTRNSEISGGKMSTSDIPSSAPSSALQGSFPLLTSALVKFGCLTAGMESTNDRT